MLGDEVRVLFPQERVPEVSCAMSAHHEEDDDENDDQDDGGPTYSHEPCTG